MEQYRMKPFAKKPNIHVRVPGSKSITNRALLLAALSEGRSVLRGVLFSEDSRVFMEALRQLGYKIESDEERAVVEVEGHGCSIPKGSGKVYVGSAGTAARFLTAMLALSGGHYELTSSEQMKKRPMRPLLEALEQLGVRFEYKEEPYSFPFVICKRESTRCDTVDLNIDASSQFLSALLLAGVFVDTGFTVRLTGKRDARSYVEITRKMMGEFGCEMEQRSENEYQLLPGQRYRAREYYVEPDVSAACYFYAMAAVNGGTALVEGVHMDCSQGDIRFLTVLENMGCTLQEGEKGVSLTGPSQKLRGCTVKMSDFSDQTMTLAAVAVFGDSPTDITGVEHIRRQESDRIRGTVTELRRLGIDCDEWEDGFRVYPGLGCAREDHPVALETYGDHRMAMALAVIGTRIPGVCILDPMCCGKTFENYFDILTNLDLSLE